MIAAACILLIPLNAANRASAAKVPSSERQWIRQALARMTLKERVGPSLDYQPVSLNALVGAVFGEFSPSGRLPVTVRQPPPSTAVLYPFGFGLGLP